MSDRQDGHAAGWSSVMRSDREFEAPWGMALKVLTGLVLALVCVPIVVFARLSDAPPIVGWVMVGVPLTLTVACALFTVRGYVLDGQIGRAHV